MSLNQIVKIDSVLEGHFKEIHIDGGLLSVKLSVLTDLIEILQSKKIEHEGRILQLETIINNLTN